MSLDLFVVRAERLTWSDALRAFDAIAAANEGVTFRTLDEDAVEVRSGYFWKAERVVLSLATPEEDEVGEDDPKELAFPFVVVSSGSGAWPWIEWTAFAVAAQLGARVYDPQNDAFVDGPSEHDPAALRALHDDDVRARKRAIVSRYYGTTPAPDRSPAGLRPYVDAIADTAREVLKSEAPIALSAQQVNLSHAYMNGDVELKVSTSLGYLPGSDRTFTVEGPAGDPTAAAFADALARRVGIVFRTLDEYR